MYLAFFVKYCYTVPTERAGPAPKGGSPMSVTDTIALLMLVITAIALGNNLKK